MKIAISISAYTNSPASLELTKQCIRNIKENTNYFVICTNHLPGDEELAKLCDLYLYEKNNILTTHTFYSKSWLITDRCRLDFDLVKTKNNTYHGPAVQQNIYNGVSLAKLANVDYVICTNFDVLLSNDDFFKIDNVIAQLDHESKSAFFLKTMEQEGYHLKTVFFITKPDFYLKKIQYINDENDYNAFMLHSGAPSNGLENMYYHTFESNLNECLVIEQSELEFFPGGSSFTNSQAEYYAVLPMTHGGTHSNTACIACTFKNKSDERTLFYEVYEDKNLILSGKYEIQSAGWFVHDFKMNDTNLYEIVFNVVGIGNTMSKTLTYNGYQDILNAGGVNYF